MATYSGNIETFSKMIGPRLRNIVQSKISRAYKNTVGKCEHCGKTKNETVLEAAHVTGKERPTLLKNAYQAYLTEENTLSNVDLEEFEQKFIDLHLPLENTFKILCKPCHQQYDKIDGTISIDELPESSKESIDGTQQEFKIELYPENKDEFTQLLLDKKSATIEIFYNDGNTAKKEWNATRFTESSDVYNNLRSRAEFRKENREKNGIYKIIVSIDY